MLLISLAIVLSNLRIIPSSAPVYDTVWDYLVPIAIPLLLFQADLRRVFREAGATLVAFIIGSATVVAGTIVAMSIIDLGPSEPELAGIFTGTYIGGSLNFAAVAEATKFRDETLLAATFAADNIITNLHLLVIIMLPGIAGFARLVPQSTTGKCRRKKRRTATNALPDRKPRCVRIGCFPCVDIFACGDWQGNCECDGQTGVRDPGDHRARASGCNLVVGAWSQNCSAFQRQAMCSCSFFWQPLARAPMYGN